MSLCLKLYLANTGHVNWEWPSAGICGGRVDLFTTELKICRGEEFRGQILNYGCVRDMTGDGIDMPQEKVTQRPKRMATMMIKQGYCKFTSCVVRISLYIYSIEIAHCLIIVPSQRYVLKKNQCAKLLDDRGYPHLFDCSYKKSCGKRTYCIYSHYYI